MKKFLLAVLMLMIPTLVAAQTPESLIDHAITDLLEAKKLLAPPPIPQPPTFIVVQGDDLQSVINNTPDGSTIELADGSTFQGPIILRGENKTLKGLGTVTSPNSGTALIVDGSGWLVKEVTATGNCNDCIVVNGSTTILDGITVRGTGSTKRGITLNSGWTAIVNSRIEDIYRVGQDSTGIGGWNGPGPYIIENNYIEAASYSIMFGGADPSTLDLVPSDIVIRGNTLTKDLTWKGKGYSVKNNLELKNARRVLIENNLLENSWTDGQTGYSVLFSVRNQDGNCPWCTIEDVTFTRNTIKNVGGGFSILGNDYSHPSQRGARISIVDNDIELCRTGLITGTGNIFFLNDGPDNLEISNNRTTNCAGGSVNSFLSYDKPTHQLLGHVVSGNIFQEGNYGILGAGGPGLGVLAWNFYAPTGVWTNNTVIKYPNGRTIKYPTGTTVVVP